MKKLVILFLFCLLFVFFNTALYSQQIIHLDSKDGLISGTINAFERDSLGYMWIGTDQGVNRYSGVEFKNYDLDENNKIKGKEIADLLNVKGNLYAISSGGSLIKYHYEKDRFEELYTETKNRFISLTNLNDSNILIGLSAGFIVYDLSTHRATEVQFKNFINNRKVEFYNNMVYAASSRGLLVFSYKEDTKKLALEQKYLSDQDIIDFAFDSETRIWVGTEVGGLYIINKEDIKNIPISQISNKTYAIRQIDFDKNNNALIAIDRLGLFLLDDKFEIVKSYSHNEDNQNSISQNSIYEIYVDDTNAYWLGVREGGINIVYDKENVFTNIKHVQNKANSIQNNNIRSIYESTSGAVWFGTENGVSKYDENKNWTNYNKDPKLYNTAVLAVNEYQNNLMLGTYGEGLLVLNQDNGKVSNFKLESKKPSKFIFRIRAYDDNLWIGGSDAPLTHFKNSRFVNTYSVGLVRSLVEGYDNINYVGTNTGFFELNTRNASIRKIEESIFNAFNEIYDLNLDYVNNCIWIGSKNGLYKYNLSTEQLENLADNTNKRIGTVYSIKKDNMQNLYFASVSGLWRYDIKNKFFRKYGLQDGMLIDEFGIGASAKFKDGRLAFGGAKGAVVFNPIDLFKDRPLSDIFISNFQINGKEPDSLTLSKNINYTKKLVLNYDQNTISFNYETIKFHGSKSNAFQSKLKGFDKDYHVSYGNEKIYYSNLNPGTYQLHVKGFNADGVKGDNDYTLEIVVKKPFWKSIWAFGFYMLLFLLIVYLIFRISRANIQKRFDENRIKFFVEVAHDIRTPVSLIQLLVKQLTNQENTEKSIELIQRNSQNLNEYVTQLLDFQKIDRKQLKLSVSKVDLKDCLAKIINDFTPILQEKSLDISLEVKHIPVWFDKAKMNRIFYNLISNAIKYSNEGGEIKVKAYLDDSNFKIEFIDNGVGIPEKQQELIFKRFTRGTNVSNKGIPGTGIGLLLSKKIVELHGGKILLESKENIGSKFTIVLPSGTEHYSDEHIVDESNQEEAKANVDELITKNKLILLVEDNEELRGAVKNELVKNYTVIEASNGKEGLLLALSKNPDLIITDVMMPEMDGKELCNLLKTNFKTSHIPVVMLTALADIDDKIQGLETGADAYVEKPFNVSILTATINNLIRSRENVNRLLGDKEVKKQMTPDESFLSDVINVIKENLTEKDFSIDTLCEVMGLSRSNLFRKLKGLVHMSPSDLIVKIKLGHAEELMKKKAHSRISDIAYESGFQDPKYFSTLFKKHYGKTPKEFMENN
ncbi:hybrid sensor histidine kinase/response regulator transcription factor [Algibacter luteus]|uniref:hybrid sensor histidine kinase/response regulator transcription factor n=1 Tax=Algibacter luteus TaxID=1178825 RepID=UPI0025915508|nr:ATP-binding protein [Algibacter luteus]WJJ95727.1 ATP-binding protein [Algibacter luteus]